LEVNDGVALLTMVGVEGAFPWGTRREEHRWNPIMVRAISSALDEVEKDPEVHVVVVANDGKFWSNGMDLKFIDAHDGQQVVKEHGLRLNELMARICCFSLPTVAALGGHWCAAGGMMGLAFDYRVMSSDRGFFFVPGVDLGLVYAPLQVALMKAKMPVDMHREVIVMNTRKWVAEELVERRVVAHAVPAVRVLSKALELASTLKPKGTGPARKAMGGIKREVYREVIAALGGGGDMGYAGRTRGVDRAVPTLGPGSKL